MASERALPKHHTRTKCSAEQVEEERTQQCREKKLVASRDIEIARGREKPEAVKRRSKTQNDLQLTPTMLTKNSCSPADNKTRPVRRHDRQRKCDSTPDDQKSGRSDRSSHKSGSGRRMKTGDGGHVTEGGSHVTGDGSHVTGREEDLVSAWKKCCARRLCEKQIAEWLENRMPAKYTGILNAL